jgi:hypothetical protein
MRNAAMELSTTQLRDFAVKVSLIRTQEVTQGAVAPMHTQQTRNIAVMAWSTPFLAFDEKLFYVV